MFELERFVEACRVALSDGGQKAVRELVAEAVSDPAGIVAALGEPKRGGVEKLHRSGDLTILNFVWAPNMTLMPHNHAMWAVIGVYGGREDNIFWRRLSPGEGGGLEAAGAKSLGCRNVAPLGRDIIHSVTNPTPRFTGAIHVYGGDFFAAPRREWDPETHEEGPYDLEKNLRLFEAANARAAA